MTSFMEAIVRMGIFMICAQVLIHFRPNGSYEKYMKLLVSVMVLAQIFFPVMNLFLGEGQEMEDRVALFSQKAEEARQEALQNAGKSEEVLNQMTLEELRNQLESKEQEITIDKVEVKIGEK